MTIVWFIVGIISGLTIGFFSIGKRLKELKLYEKEDEEILNKKSDLKSIESNILVRAYTRYSSREGRDRSRSSNIPIYYEEEANAYIWERLTRQEQKRLSEKGVGEIINIEFEYIRKAKEFYDEGMVYIQKEALKKGNHYSLEDIERVSDIECGYLEKIGAIDNNKEENGKLTFD